jgi:hypothetical protein
MSSMLLRQTLPANVKFIQNVRWDKENHHFLVWKLITEKPGYKIESIQTLTWVQYYFIEFLSKLFF